MSGITRWNQWGLRRPFSGNDDQDIKRLKDLAAELGSQVGWRRLSREQAAGMIRGEVALAASIHFGPPGEPVELSEQREARLRNERNAIEANLTSHRPHQTAPPVAHIVSPRQAPVRWVMATGNVVAASALLGLAAEASGIHLGWIGRVALGLCGVLVLLNWTGWPALTRNLLALVGRRVSSLWRRLADLYLGKRANSLDKQIAEAIRQREAEFLRRSHMDQWSSQVEAVVLGCFDFYISKAEKVAETRTGSPRQPDFDSSVPGQS
jgi:hypothetical protein